MNMGGGAGVPDDNTAASAVTQFSHAVWRRYQHLLDKSTPLVLYRWIFFAAIAFIYALRVYLVQGFYIITYGLGIYILQLLIAFLSPQVDPEIQELTDGPSLPTRGSEEFRPFVRRLPEFKFWWDEISFLDLSLSVLDCPFSLCNNWASVHLWHLIQSHNS